MGDEHGNNTTDFKQVFPPPTAPMAVARELMPEFTDEDDLMLRHWRGQWMAWKGPHWVEVEEREIRSRLYQRLEHAVYPAGKGQMAPWDPNRHKMANLLEALGAIVHLPAAVDAPSWIIHDAAATMSALPSAERPGGPIVSCTNGLLDVPTRKLADHDPLYWNLVSVPFDYNPAAPPPDRWLRFLAEVWPDDPDSIAALQEWFGYVLSGRLDMQKILLIVGPTRSGKGTIARVVGALIGKANVCGPTLSSFGTNFGLSPMLGKPLAVISDARLSGHDTHQVVERLLTISGEDTITVDRKYRDLWTGKLPTRIMMLSNELPNFGDASGTIAHRFIVLQMTRSWLGRENHRLTEELTDELPGILNWALGGLERLTSRGVFTEPASMREAIAVMKDSASPMSAFVRERCEVRSGAEVDVDELYRTWRDWCHANGRDRPGSKQAFGRSLRSVVPQVRMIRPRNGDERTRMYVGIEVKPQWPGPRTIADQTQGETDNSGQADDVVRDGPRSNPMSAQLNKRGEMSTCAACGLGMYVVEDGQTTHPNCQEQP